MLFFANSSSGNFPSRPKPHAANLCFSMSRLTDAFARAKNENRAAFVAYLCAGDPDFDGSLAACRTLISARVDVLELGAPFSDPLADGVANQLAAQRALEAGMTTARVFDLAKRIRVS